MLQILLFHPNVEIGLVTDNEHAGKAVADVHRNLEGLTDIVFSNAPVEFSIVSDYDVAFFALPHGQALHLIPKLPANVKAIDLSGDFHIDDHDVFKEFYNLDQTSAELQKNFVYGLSESNREVIASASFIANPACFATATLLASAPTISSGGFHRRRH